MKSAALQWAALCVCPPAILATSVATVPQVKRAVHQATRAPAKAMKPKPAQRPVKTAAVAKGQPCHVAPAIPASALLAYADPLPLVDTTDGLAGNLPGTLMTGGGVTGGSGTPIRFGFGGGPGGGGGGGGDAGGGDGGGDAGGGDGGTPVVPGAPVPPVTPVPEPQTWLLMIAGFGFVGMGLRWRRARAATASGPVIGNTFSRRRTKAAGGASTLMASLGFGEVATGSASMATIAAKTMLCICPTVAVVGSTMAVPPVRNAVHAATRTAQVKSAMVMPVKPPCDPTLRSAEATPPSSRIIDGGDASPKVATALLASTSTGGQ